MVANVKKAVVADDGAYSALYLDGKLVSPVEIIEDLAKALNGQAVVLEFRNVHDNHQAWPVSLGELATRFEVEA